MVYIDPQPTIAAMRDRDRRAGRRPLLCETARLMDDTLHWSRTHDWPSVCDEMQQLGVVKRVAEPGYSITEITDLGRAVRDALRTEVPLSAEEAIPLVKF